MRALPVVLCGAILFVGCGKGIGSKEDAAAAASSLLFAGNNAQAGKLWSGIDASFTVSGKSGTAAVTVTTSGGQLASQMTFDSFSADGKNTFDGTVTYLLTVSTTASGVQLGWTMKGDVTISGDYDAHMTVDLTETISATALSQNGAKVSVTLTGTVTADGKTFRFDNETLSVVVSG